MPDLIRTIVVSAGLGALIGLIRQWGEQAESETTGFAGVRTHTLWAVLGCLAAFASDRLAPFAFVAVLLIVSAHLIMQAAKRSDELNPGATSLAGAMLTLFCGALVFWEETKPAILVTATTMVLVGVKKPVHAWTRRLTESDIRATLQFVAITGVILPLVPDRDLGPYGGFNPFSTWLMVVLISGLGFAGYIAIRFIGPRAGLLVMSLLGGLASSTASTLAFSRRSRETPSSSEDYAVAVVAACTVMLPRVVIATGFVNQQLALSLVLPFTVMAVPGIAYIAWAWLRHRIAREAGEAPKLGNPLSLATAIKFAVLYAAIAFGVKALREQGSQGLIPLSFVSGLTDMDAISLSVARDYGTGSAVPTLATRAVVVAAISNTLLKTGLAAALGSTALKLRTATVLGATAIAGLAWVWLLS
jgi:uncharacterized membrane protein (DUF4010 family)